MQNKHILCVGKIPPDPKLLCVKTLKEDCNICDSISAFDAKVDLFMERHVLTAFDPSDIFWWFSVSGGKDSFAMVHGIQNWYNRNGISAEIAVFHINQWGGRTTECIVKHFKEYDFRIIDGCALTGSRTKYEFGQQAPCRECADVRRDLNDELVYSESLKNNKINFICRALHLSDVAVSLLWRYSILNDPVSDMTKAQKGQPLSRLWHNTFLAKPLSYVREYEAQQYAQSLHFEPVCCGCPACLFPSRRDIVEETLLQFNRSTLWEFSVPGLNDLLCHWVDAETAYASQNLSAPGLEIKKAHLPVDFGDFAVDFFRKKGGSELPRKIRSLFDPNVDLDEIGRKRLEEYHPLVQAKRLPLPSLLSGEKSINNLEALMIGALGPFWGAIGLTHTLSEKAFRLQRLCYDLSIDKKWNHVTQLLNEYYRRNYVSKPQAKESIVCNLNLAASCICSH